MSSGTIRCFKCHEVFRSPTDNDAFRDLFSDFGGTGIRQAEAVSSAYIARKEGWGNIQDLWACPPCLEKG